MAGQRPAFNLNAVIKATGLSADVLRAWERRYGLPRPQRTPGGHRLYSEWDIEVVRWLKARQTEGLAISRAVDLWNEAVEAGADPLANSPLNGAAPQSSAMETAEGRMDSLRHTWSNACLAFDALKADDVLNEALAVYPVETVVTELLQRAISEVGERWYLGQVTEQQEHFASGIAGRRLESLIAAAPHPTRPQTVCIGCPPGEWHTFPIQILGLLLQRRGLSVLYFGADVPVERLVEAAGTARPDLVILAAQRLTTAATLRRAAVALQAGSIALAYSGSVFSRIPGLRDRIPAYFLGESLKASIGTIEQLLIDPSAYPAPVIDDRSHAGLAREYREKQAPIELTVIKRLQGAGLDAQSIRIANDFLGSGLAAALELGDPAFIEDDLEWVDGLLAVRRIPAEGIEAYLTAYVQTARKALGETGRPVTEWISSYLKRRKDARRGQRRGQTGTQ